MPYFESDMSEQELEEFLIHRELDEPVSKQELEAVGEQSGEVLEEHRTEGVEISIGGIGSANERGKTHHRDILSLSGSGRTCCS